MSYKLNANSILVVLSHAMMPTTVLSFFIKITISNNNLLDIFVSTLTFNEL